MPRQVLTARTWTAVLWCASMAYAIRGYLGLPGLPHGLAPLAPWAWPVIAVATVMAVAGAWSLPRRPLVSIGLLVAASAAAPLATDRLAIATLQFIAVSVALGHVVATRSRGTGVIAFGLVLLLLPVYPALRSLLGFDVPRANDSAIRGPWEVLALLAVVAWLIGNSVRQVRQYTGRLRVQAAAQAVTAERLRIARELHDMVAHSIGIIALQSGAASRVIDTQPAAARDAMAAVETTSRETLAGLRRMLGALREPAAAPRQPAPTLADVDRLAETTTAAGVRVDVSWQGTRRPLPPDLELSAYRIVQESVTNVVRHAAASCEVTLGYGDEHLTIDVADNGRGRPGADDTGYGLAGMRERVALLHGDLTAAPRPEGGFRVTARLPLPLPASAR